MIIWRTEALTQQIDSIKDIGDRLVLHCTSTRPDEFSTLPRSLLEDEASIEMALTAGKRSAFCAYFVGILKQMLKGTSVETTRDSFAENQVRHRYCD